jgi:hypothetical protein
MRCWGYPARASSNDWLVAHGASILSGSARPMKKNATPSGAFDDGHAAPELGRLDRGMMPGRTRADHDDLVARHAAASGTRPCVTSVKAP